MSTSFCNCNDLTPIVCWRWTKMWKDANGVVNEYEEKS